MTGKQDVSTTMGCVPFSRYRRLFLSNCGRIGESEEGMEAEEGHKDKGGAPDLLRFAGTARVKLQGKYESWAAHIAKDDGASDNFVDRQWLARLSARHPRAVNIEHKGWMTVDTADARAPDGVEKREVVNLRIHIGSLVIKE